MSARVTEAHLWKAADIATRLPLSKTPEDGCRREEIIAQALADAEQAEREAIANWHDRQARYYKSNEMYPAYCLNAQVSTHEESAAAIRARGTTAKEKADG